MNVGVKTWGSKKDPAILCLHGWMDNAASFDLIAPKLKNYFLIAPDLPGHGQSQHLPPRQHYHFIDAIPFVFDLIKELKLDQPFLMGHSMGAAIALMSAMTRPDQVSKLILFDALGPLTSDEKSFSIRMSQYLDQRDETNSKPAHGYDSFEKILRARLIASPMPEEAARLILKRSIIEREGKFYWKSDPRLMHNTPVRLTEAHILYELSKLKSEVLLFVASNGWITQTNSEPRIQVMSNMKRVDLSGHHYAHLEHNDATVSHILKFLDS